MARPFTWLANGTTAALLVTMAALAAPAALAARRRRRAGTGSEAAGTGSFAEPGATRTAAVWTVLLAVLVAVELSAWSQSPRRLHPTLSSLAAPLSDTTPGRLVAFAVLAALGWLIAT